MAVTAREAVQAGAELDVRRDVEARGHQLVRPSQLKVGDVFTSSSGLGDRLKIVEIDPARGRVVEQNLRTGAVEENPWRLRASVDNKLRRIPAKVLKAEASAPVKSASDKAHDETALARRTNSDTSHAIASAAHRAAQKELATAGDTEGAAHHLQMSNAHNRLRYSMGMGEARAANLALDEAIASRPKGGATPVAAPKPAAGETKAAIATPEAAPKPPEPAAATPKPKGTVNAGLIAWRERRAALGSSGKEAHAAYKDAVAAMQRGEPSQELFNKARQLHEKAAEAAKAAGDKKAETLHREHVNTSIRQARTSGLDEMMKRQAPGPTDKASKLKAFADEKKHQLGLVQRGKKGGLFVMTKGGKKSYVGKK